MSDVPLLLLGAQRSGTTAFAHALSQAFAAAGGMFTVNGRLPYLLPRWCREEDLQARHFRADELLHALARKPAQGAGVEAWQRRVETVLRDVAGRIADGELWEPASLTAHLLRECYRPWNRWGDKYNEHLLDLAGLIAMVGPARMIMLTRHPGEVARSQLAWSGDRPWRPSTAEQVQDKWAAWHRGWLETVDRLPPGSWMVVDYHRLCRGEATDLLSEFAGLDLGPHLQGLSARRPPDPGPAATADAARVWKILDSMERDS